MNQASTATSVVTLSKLITVASFDHTDGSVPAGGVISDAAGNLFGPTGQGGPSDAGTVFEVAAGSGAITTLASFNGTNGQDPNVSLIEDASGNLFGVTAGGGDASNDGTVFEVTAGSHAITTLALFSGTNGADPNGTLIEDASGNLFGTTELGGAFSDGTVFEVAAGSHAITTLASFNGANGFEPFGSLVEDGSGNLFGAATDGGAYGDGDVFEVAAGSNAITTLASFNGANGQWPQGGLIMDGSGNLFGTTYTGGANSDGTVFEVSAVNHAITTLASFNGANGKSPLCRLVEDGSGDLFGDAILGGAYGDGTLFEVAAGSGAITALISFNGANGQSPEGDLVDVGGNLYGTAALGGANSDGTVFEYQIGASTATVSYGQSATFTATVSSSAGVPPDGSVQFLVNGTAYGSPVALSGATAQLAISEPVGSFTIGAEYTGDANYAATVAAGETTGTLTVNQASTGTAVTLSNLINLASFDYTDGSFATGGVISDAAGNLFGTTSQGGTYGDGTVFEVAAGSGAITILATFNGTNGQGPRAGLLLDASGNLFGTAYGGGSASDGTVFEVAAGSHAITTLATFNGSNGANPNVTLIEDSSGNLFGTTQYGGASSDGAVFEVVKGSGVATALASFNGGNGFEPVTSLVEDGSGNLFGTATDGGASGDGTVFEVAAGSHAITTLASFNGTNGQWPEGGLMMDASGTIFGTTYAGGAYSDGTVFKLAAGSHALTTLASFNGTNGENPICRLVEDGSGNLFGDATEGGAFSDGTVFELAAGSSTITALASFNTATTGGSPWGDLAEYGGNLYGATAFGGADSDGTVFEYQMVTPPATVGYGQSVSFTATVSSPAGTPPDGSVQFLVNGVAYGSPVALSGATAQLAIFEPVGSYTIAAQYTGDTDFAATLPAAETTSTLTVNPSGSQTSLQSSKNPSNYGDSVTFTASVSPTSSTPGLATPTGQVEFFDGSTLLDTETLSGGTASYTTSSLLVGANQQIEAKYLGDSNYNPSSLTIPQTVNTPPQTDIWTGASAAKGGNDNWSNPGNWTFGAAPTAAETAYFTASESQYSTANVDTSFSIAGLTIDSTWGGTVGVSGSLTISGNLILANGTLGGNGAVSVAGSGSQFSGGNLGGNVTNLGTLTVTKSGVTLTGTLTNAGSIVVDTGVTIYQGSTSSGASIINQAGATFDLQGNAYLDNAYTNGSVYVGATFTNAGILEKSTGTGAATMGYALVDTGPIIVSSATLDPTGGVTGTQTTITVAPGATYLMTGTYTGSFSGLGCRLGPDLRGFGWRDGHVAQLHRQHAPVDRRLAGRATDKPGHADSHHVGCGAGRHADQLRLDRRRQRGGNLPGRPVLRCLDHQPGRRHLRPSGHRLPRQRLHQQQCLRWRHLHQRRYARKVHRNRHRHDGLCLGQLGHGDGGDGHAGPFGGWDVERSDQRRWHRRTDRRYSHAQRRGVGSPGARRIGHASSDRRRALPDWERHGDQRRHRRRNAHRHRHARRR